MTDVVVSPAYVLRDYAWAVLKASDPTVWNASKYGGQVPIIPLNDDPDLSEYPGPRIIYEFSETDRGVTMYRGRGNMTFAVRDNDFRRMGKTINTLAEAFGRLDESAADVNDYIDRVRAGRGVAFDVSFGMIRLELSQSGTPEEEEGGQMVAIVNISYDFFVEYNVNTRPPV